MKNLRRIWLRHAFVASLCLLCACPALSGAEVSGEESAPDTDLRGDLVIVVGAPGTDEYAAEFRRWASVWKVAGESGGLRVTALGMESNDATLQSFQAVLKGLPARSQLPLWILLIGHGTFDSQTAKFNLPEADLEPQVLREGLKDFNRPIAFINCTSASGAFLQTISAPNRVVITATSNGSEINFAHFGEYLSEAISGTDADLDKDGQVSLLEAFLRASSQTEEFYAADGRLPTEHAILDDNGDGRPVPVAGFDGLRAIDREDSPGRLPDGHVAHQWHLIPSAVDARLSPEELARRNEIERQIAVLLEQKETMNEQDYFAKLEPLFLELARLLVDDSESARQTREP